MTIPDITKSKIIGEAFDIREGDVLRGKVLTSKSGFPTKVDEKELRKNLKRIYKE